MVKPPLKIYKNVQFVMSEEPLDLAPQNQNYDIMRDAIIEQCAQVAHSFRERFVNHPMEMADMIVAAIHAMKQKPRHGGGVK